MTSSYWCPHAWVDGATASGVRLEVADGRISAVEPDAEAREGDERLTGMVLPGFANAHSHAFHRALRGRTHAGPGSFWTWREQMYRAAGRLGPESYHRLARATFAEMALAGITAVGEFHYLHHQQDGAPYPNANAMGEALIDAAADAGIRITLLDTVYLHGGLDSEGYQAVAEEQRRFSDGRVPDWRDRVATLRPARHVRIGAAIHSVRAVDHGAIVQVAQWTRELEYPLHVHVSEQPAENEQVLAHHGVTPTGVLHDSGALGPLTTLVHGTHLSPGDIDAVARTGTGVCFCPTTERDLADGIGPAGELAAAGVALPLGSDSHAVIDVFEEARALELDERLRTGRRGTISAGALLAAAGENGHRALGWDDAGRIQVGARADFVVVDLASVRTAGTPADAALVFTAGGADVTDVVADGVRLVANRSHCRIDVAESLRSAITEVMDP